MPVKKNILLINPWIFDFTAYDFWLKPLGLLIIASFLKRCGNFHLSYIDCVDRHHPSLNKRMQTKEDGRGAFPKEEIKKPEILKRIPRKYSRYGISIDLFLHELDQVVRPDIVLMTCTMTPPKSTSSQCEPASPSRESGVSPSSLRPSMMPSAMALSWRSEAPEQMTK